MQGSCVFASSYLKLFLVLSNFFSPHRYVRNMGNASDIPTAVEDFQLRVPTAQ